MNRPSTTSLPIILDTDPGLDDAVALLVLSAFAKDRLDTVISSYGNVSLDHTTRNLLRCCALYDIAPYLIRGSAHPLAQTAFTDAADIHGADGLAGVDLLPAKLPVAEQDPLQKLYDRISRLGRVDYITLGPLTNLAALLSRFPDVQGHMNRVITMGGGFSKGNITPYAEFNVYCDPDAAKIVCDAQLDQLFVPLNATHQIALSVEEINAICKTRSRKSGYVKQLLMKNYETNTAQGDEGCIIHDASAVIAYLFPECFETVSGKVAVVTTGEHIGETTLLETGRGCHRVAVRADRGAVIEILTRSLAE